MKTIIQSLDLTMQHGTRTLMRRMVSPLCGLDQRVSFMTRGRFDPPFMTAGAQLTGVHVLQKRPEPKFTAYHIGGGGIFLDEPLIRTFGETIERYSQLLSEVAFGHCFVVASYEAIAARGEPVLAPEKLRIFTDAQYEAPQMPFQRFDPNRPMAWTRGQSLTQGSTVWVPSQLLFVGYRPKTEDGEPWLTAAMTTGTASHTAPERAMRNALLELIQVDAAMGHWYTDARAPEIVPDQRASPLVRLLEKHFPHPAVAPKFYWLPSPDLPGLCIACVVRSGSVLPAIAVGLGSDLSLISAMYKALLEAVSVRQLAKINLLYQSPTGRDGWGAPEPGPITDFDSNVAWYARHENHEVIDAKFNAESRMQASDLPADSREDLQEQNTMLVDAFRRTDKQLVFMDLTTDDVRELGFRTFRLWSPDVLGLSLPSFPTGAHRRFQSYGGVTYERPHPYA
jgi:thiazole/oxazole-forming peptide maturase SagD family component